MLLAVSFSAVMSLVGRIVLAILILLFMITIHEFGHFSAGKLLGFQINEFAIGMGPKIFRKKTKGGEYFSLRVFPLGGYCAFEGEDEGDNTNPGAFNNQAPWKRIIVLFSGAFFNFVSAILISIIAFSCFGENVLVVKDVFADSANASSFNTQEGFCEEDIIYSVNGHKLYLAVDLSDYISKADSTMSVVVLRKNDENKYKKVNLTINKAKYTSVTKTTFDADGNAVAIDYLSYYDDMTYEDTDTEKYLIETQTGWGITQGYQKHVYGFGESLGRSFGYCFRAGTYVLETLGGLFTGKVALTEMGGPITTIDVSTQVISTGLGNTLFLIILISVNLAVFNLLPLPALDGARIVFVIIEWIRKKPIDRKIEGIVHAVGLVLLLVLVVVLDSLRYIFI